MTHKLSVILPAGPGSRRWEWERGWICKVTGNTDFLTTARTCGWLTLVKTRLCFHLVSVWFYRLEGFGTQVSAPRANRWFLPCVSPAGFIYCVSYARFTTRCSSKVSLFGKTMAGAKGRTPGWSITPHGTIPHFQLNSTFPEPNSALSSLLSCHLHLNLVPNLYFTCP